MTSRDLLHAGARELGISLTPDQMDSMFQYLAELKKWNARINLTAIREERETVIKHVLDSLSYSKGFSIKPGLRLLDMGSGAGFPALPIKIAYPEISVMLVESVKKKASFLRHIVRMLRLSGIEVSDKRTDELSDFFHGAYDVVTARAFADMFKALKAGLPFLKSGGLIVLSRGPGENISEQELLKIGDIQISRLELTLPGSNYKRVIWVFKRIV